MLNVVCLNGRLTATPELRSTQSGISVTSFTVAVNRRFQRDGETNTDFIDIVAWRQSAEFACKYFQKGQLVGVQGTLQVRNYVDKDNNKRRAWEVVAENLYFAESKRSFDQDGGDNQMPRPAQNTQPNFSNADPGDFEEIQISDDDLPF